jgi:hypothetical protein
MDIGDSTNRDWKLLKKQFELMRVQDPGKDDELFDIKFRGVWQSLIQQSLKAQLRFA